MHPETATSHSPTTPQASTRHARQNRRRDRATAILALVVFASVLCLAVAWAWTIAYAEPAAGEMVQVVVGQGWTARRIGAMLEQADLVPNGWLFDVTARLTGTADRLKAGEYIIRRGTGMAHIVDAMAKGRVAQVRVTLAEGLTARQIGAALEDAGVVAAQTFMSIVGEPPAWVRDEFGFVEEGASLEGYLFPDTYSFARGVPAATVVRTMLARFESVVLPEYESASSGLSLRDAVILSSIVEREARVAQERPIIAGVFLRRLAMGMALQSCATVQYVLPVPKERLSTADTQIDSPYNTYLVTGLPPGPISNPGLSSIKAVMAPAVGSALYFVARPDGSHVFSSSYSDHLTAKARIEREAER